MAESGTSLWRGVSVGDGTVGCLPPDPAAGPDLLRPGRRDVLEQVCANGRAARKAVAWLDIPEGTAFPRLRYALRAPRPALGGGPADPERRVA